MTEWLCIHILHYNSRQYASLWTFTPLQRVGPTLHLHCTMIHSPRQMLYDISSVQHPPTPGSQLLFTTRITTHKHYSVNIGNFGICVYGKDCCKNLRKWTYGLWNEERLLGLRANIADFLSSLKKGSENEHICDSCE